MCKTRNSFIVIVFFFLYLKKNPNNSNFAYQSKMQKKTIYVMLCDQFYTMNNFCQMIAPELSSMIRTNVSQITDDISQYANRSQNFIVIYGVTSNKFVKISPVQNKWLVGPDADYLEVPVISLELTRKEDHTIVATSFSFFDSRAQQNIIELINYDDYVELLEFFMAKKESVISEYPCPINPSNTVCYRLFDLSENRDGMQPGSHESDNTSDSGTSSDDTSSDDTSSTTY